MIKWTPYVFVRFTIYLMAGILLAIFYNIPEEIYRYLLLGFCIAFLFYWLAYVLTQTVWKGRLLQSVFGLLALIILVISGTLRTYHVTGSRHKDHIIHQDSSFSYYSGTIISEVQERPKNYKTELMVDRIQQQGEWRKATGKVLVYLGKQSNKPRYGSQLVIKGMPQQVPPPANPGEFDYRKYLKNQQIYVQQFIKPADYIIYRHNRGNPVIALSFRLRQQADSIFKALIPSSREYAIATGLILGIRNGLDNELRQAYASAGAMHVLAVSGAHVVIVFEILAFMLGKLKNLKYGNWIFAATVIGLLWFYALITGFSPSVLRAVVMFTLVIIEKAAARQKSIYNSLAISAFVLLCYNPYYVMDVGFQLSYAAVLGIVYLFPKLYYLLNFDNWLADKAWAITCVSFAAQIGTIPIGLYYFHQFPTYFLLANLAVIPLSTGVLYAGLLTLAVFWIPYVSVAVAFLLKWVVWALNQSVFLTERIPGALIQGVYINLLQAICLYTIIVLVLLFLYYKKLGYWYAVFGVLCLLTGINLLKINQQHAQKELLIYAVNNHSAACVIEGTKSYFLADSALLQDKAAIQYRFTNYWWQKGVKEQIVLLLHEAQPGFLPIRKSKEGNWLIWQDKTFLFMHKPISTKADFLQLAKPDYLVVQNNAIRSLKYLSFIKSHLIIDASNKRYIAERLKKQADSLNIPCYVMHDSGAFVLKIND